MKMSEAQKQFYLDEAEKYVSTLEKELTRASAQNAYHALVKLHNLSLSIESLNIRYAAACEKVNDRFPS